MTIISFGGSNFLRLASNLILTRLLFPEAFGLMALVQVFMSGLNMFSDFGIRTSIIQNARGDDPDFLNTAWTVQIGRGVFLWLAGVAVAVPAAGLYNEPQLVQLLPVVALNALIAGVNSTNVATANRHLMLGRLTAIELGARALGILVMITLAYLTQSVWALVVGGLVGNTAKMLLFHQFMPGIRNRLHWDKSAFREIFGFGKYIFFSTIAGYLINQGDRALLGGFLSLSELGVYSVGFLLGTVPFALCNATSNKVIFPLYRMRPPADSTRNRDQLFQARRLSIAAALGFSMVLAFGGVLLVGVLYDPRYVLAGPIVVLLSLGTVPQIVLAPYTGVLIANGDSRRFLILQAGTAMIQVLYLYIGISWLGIFGAVLGPGLAFLTTYPLRVRYLRLYGAWDPRGDLGFMVLGFAVSGFACWLHWSEIVQLIS